MKVIDLSQTLESGMCVYPGAPAPRFETIGNLGQGDVYSLTKFEMTTHVGTHIDCSSHVVDGGYTTGNQNVDFFIGKGIVIDCSKYEQDSEIGLEAIEDIDLSDKEYVLFYTGWAEYWGRDEFWKGYPVVSVELLELLGKMDNIKGIGVEYAAIDKIADESLPRHKLFLKNEKSVVENLTNLSLLLNKNFTLHVVPLKFKNGDGSPVRAVAIMD